MKITENTTLKELIDILGTVEKAAKTPTSKKLREEAGEPIAIAMNCTVYANGFAVYDNGSGRTVVWLPDCQCFTYYFNPMKDSEIGGEIKQTCELPESLLASEPWPIAVTLVGDHRVESNIMNRTGGRTGTKDYDADDYGDKDGDAEDAVENELAKQQRTAIITVNAESTITSYEEKPKEPKSNLAVPPFYYYLAEDIKRIPAALEAGCGYDAPGSFAAWLSSQTRKRTGCREADMTSAIWKAMRK